MPDETPQSNGTNPGINIQVPEGTQAGSKFYRRILTNAEIRAKTNERSRYLRRVDNDGGEGVPSYTYPFELGENPDDLFTRTDIQDEDEAKAIAVQYALQLPALQQMPKWQDLPWVKNGNPVVAAHHIELMLRISIGRGARKEGVQNQTGLVVPEWGKRS